jgi:hypothetical protein
MVCVASPSRRLHIAQRHFGRTSVGKTATRAQSVHGWGLTWNILQNHASPFAKRQLSRSTWQTSQQALGVRVCRLRKQGANPRRFNNLTCIHHSHALCVMGHDAQVVGDEQHAHAGVAL